jgi:hypothetical protein
MADRRVDNVLADVLATSNDAGQTWAPPTPVVQASYQLFTPAIAVSSDGTVGLSYYDFRNDVPGDSPLTTDVWLARSPTWEATHAGGPFDMRLAPDVQDILDIGSAMGSPPCRTPSAPRSCRRRAPAPRMCSSPQCPVERGAHDRVHLVVGEHGRPPVLVELRDLRERARAMRGSSFATASDGWRRAIQNARPAAPDFSLSATHGGRFSSSVVSIPHASAACGWMRAHASVSGSGTFTWMPDSGEPSIIVQTNGQTTPWMFARVTYSRWHLGTTQALIAASIISR